MQKRGQVTIFIILGIVIVVALAMVFMFRSEITEFFSELGEGEVVVPEQLQPVQTYLDDCVGQIALDGITLLASQGGYIDIPEDVLPRNDRNIFSNSLQIFPGVEVAYWFYEDTRGNQVSQIPTMSQMEEELEGYVLDRFGECVSGLDYYEELGYDIKFDISQRASVDIAKEDVNVQVRRRLEVDYKGVGDSWSKHTKNVDVSLGSLYEKSVELMNQQNSDLWLENNTLDILYLYDLPLDDVEFTCSAKIWDKRELEQDFKKYLTYNFPFYKVKNSVYDSYYHDEPLFIWDTERNFNDLSVIFEYNEDWPVDFEVEPSQGNAVISRPISGGATFIDLCVNYENFFYTIKYPALITLSNGDLEFSFANMVLLRRNQPREEMPEELINRIDYCESTFNEVDVDVVAYQNGSLLPLDGADVFFNCVAFSCYVGRTDEDGSLNKKFPLCANGVVEIKKEGYVDGLETITTFEGGDTDVSFWLEPIVDLDYSIQVRDKVGDSLSEPRLLESDEKVFLEVSKIVENRIAYGFAGIYPDDNPIISLVPEVYHVKATLRKESEIRISEQTIERCKCPKVAGICLCGNEEYTIPGTTLDSAVLGGAEYDWIINRGDLDSSKVVFYVINNGVPGDYEKLQENFDIEGITRGHYDQIEPEFK